MNFAFKWTHTVVPVLDNAKKCLSKAVIPLKRLWILLKITCSSNLTGFLVVWNNNISQDITFLRNLLRNDKTKIKLNELMRKLDVMMDSHL